MKQTKEEFTKLLRNYVQARDELLTFTMALGCNTPAGQTPGDAIHIYAKPGGSREFVHSLMDINYVVNPWNPYERRVFDTFKDAFDSCYTDAGDYAIYEEGEIDGIKVYSVYFADEIQKILELEEK